MMKKLLWTMGLGAITTGCWLQEPQPVLPGPEPRPRPTADAPPATARIATDTDMAPPQAQSVASAPEPSPAAVATQAQGSLVRQLDKKRLIPVSTLVWPPERGADPLVWKVPVTCQPLGVHKDRILCGTCESYKVTVSILDAATGNMVWGRSVGDVKNETGCMMSTDGNVLVTYRLDGNFSTNYQPYELIVLDARDGSPLGAFGYRGRQMRASKDGFAFVQQDYEKPFQVFLSNWKGEAKLLVETAKDDTAWIHPDGDELWVMRQSRKEEKRFSGTQYKWDGTLVKTSDPVPYGYDKCPGFSEYTEQNGVSYCIRYEGDRIVYQKDSGGPIYEHVGRGGLLHESGDLIRLHGGFLARHKPQKITPGAPKKSVAR